MTNITGERKNDDKQSDEGRGDREDHSREQKKILGENGFFSVTIHENFAVS